MRVQRIDRGGLAAPVSTRDGVVFEGVVARTHPPGDPLVYGDGPEHRDADELASMSRQMPGVDVFLDHPSSMPASRSGEPSIGHVLSARVDGDKVIAKIAITDRAARDAIAAGTKELSLGYECQLDRARWQRGIKIDHLAVVERARCGKTCALRTDKQGGRMDGNKNDCACTRTDDYDFDGGTITPSAMRRRADEMLGQGSSYRHTSTTAANPHADEDTDEIAAAARMKSQWTGGRR